MALFDDASLVVTPNGYKAGTLYSIKPTSGAGDMTVVRATTATRVNSAGLIESVANNVPRLDYSNGTCPSLLVEPQRTNLNYPSIPTASGGGTLVQNAIISPDGTLNANSFIPSGAGFIYANAITTSVQSYTFSLYLKGTVNGQKVKLSADLQGILATLTLTTQWERYNVTFTGVSGAQNFYILSGSYLSPAEFNLFYFWGWQIEAGSYPTSYIPTTSAAVTRNADAIYKTGISSLIGQTEGTLFVDYYASAKNQDGDSFAYLFLGGTSTDNYQIYNIGTTLYWFIRNSAGIIVNQTANQTIVSGERYKIAVAYKSGDYALYINGIQKRTSTASGVSAISQFNLNSDAFGVSAAKVKNEFNSLQFYKTRLTNSELAQLTTI